MGAIRTAFLLEVAFSFILVPKGSDGFIKAAIGLRLGYSPTEKGYGQQAKEGDCCLDLKKPLVKGQFVTGVQGNPYTSASQPHQSTSHAPKTGLLRHLKVLGVNLYLGGPDAPLHQVKNSQQYQQQVGSNGQFGGNGNIQFNQENRGQFVNPFNQHHQYVAGFESQNLVPQSSPQTPHSGEMFHLAASQYRSPYQNGFLQALKGQQQSPTPQLQNGPGFHPFAPHPPGHIQGLPSSQPTAVSPQPHNGHNVAFNPAHSGERPTPTTPQPSQGFSLASLMKGLQWAPRPSLFRIPLSIFGVQTTVSPSAQPHNAHNKGQPSKSSLPIQYSTLFRTNPNQSFSLPPPLHESSSSYPIAPPQGFFHVAPMQQHQAPIQQHQAPRHYATINHIPQQNQIPHFNKFQHQQNFGYIPQQQQPANSPQHANGHGHMIPRPGHPSQFLLGSSSERSYPRNQQNIEFGPQSNNNFGQGPKFTFYAGKDMHHTSPMPDEYKPPQGFQYSHTDSSPVISMGMTSHDDPPFMDKHGDHHHHHHQQQPPHHGYSHFHQQLQQLYPPTRPHNNVEASPDNGHAQTMSNFVTEGGITMTGTDAEAEYNRYTGKVTTTTQVQTPPSHSQDGFGNYNHNNYNHVASTMRNYLERSNDKKTQGSSENMRGPRMTSKSDVSRSFTVTPGEDDMDRAATQVTAEGHSVPVASPPTVVVNNNKSKESGETFTRRRRVRVLKTPSTSTSATTTTTDGTTSTTSTTSSSTTASSTTAILTPNEETSTISSV